MFIRAFTSFRCLSKLFLSFLMIMLEKTSVVSGDDYRHFQCTFKLFKGFIFFGRSLVPACTISISGLDYRRLSDFSKIVSVAALGRFLTSTVCCFESPLGYCSILNLLRPRFSVWFDYFWVVVLKTWWLDFYALISQLRLSRKSQLDYHQQNLDLMCHLSSE